MGHMEIFIEHSMFVCVWKFHLSLLDIYFVSFPIVCYICRKSFKKSQLQILISCSLKIVENNLPISYKK